MTMTEFNASNRVQGEYKFVMNDLGQCSTFSAASLLTKMLGYGDDEALDLVNHLPTTVAQNLTYQQAAILSKACEEYGINAYVVNANEETTTTTYTNTVTDSNGNFVNDALAALGTMYVWNRLTRPVAPPRPRPSLFGSLFNNPAPPRRNPGFGGPRNMGPGPRNGGFGGNRGGGGFGGRGGGFVGGPGGRGPGGGGGRGPGGPR